MSNTVKQLRDRLAQVEEDLYRYKNMMYSDESNDRFDEEHDSLYYHIMGFNETFEEFEAESRQDSDWTDRDAETWHKIIVQEEAFVQSLKSFYNATTIPSPNYIYA